MEIFDSGSSQNSDLGQEQLNNMEESAKADNTNRATKWGLNRFEEWQAKRAISFDWKTVSSKELYIIRCLLLKYRLIFLRVLKAFDEPLG